MHINKEMKIDKWVYDTAFEAWEGKITNLDLSPSEQAIIECHGCHHWIFVCKLYICKPAQQITQELLTGHNSVCEQSTRLEKLKCHQKDRSKGPANHPW